MQQLLSRIEITQGDITTLDVDAIVTAANEALCGGGGVDGAIHRTAGPGLFEECQKIGTCPEGEARITQGYLLPAKYVIHTVGPVWEGGHHGKNELLEKCYVNSLTLASEHNVETIAFPCIATGSYEFPRELACGIALKTVASWLQSHDVPQRVIFCCFENEDYHIYKEARSSLVNTTEESSGT